MLIRGPHADVEIPEVSLPRFVLKDFAALADQPATSMARPAGR